MLLTLKGTVSFASTGRTFTFNHDFEKGLTAITGANEAGKSLRLEMIRYALFGSKALRTTASSYSCLDVELEFKVLEVKYKVTRSKSDTSLYKYSEDGSISKVATGTTPLNAAIIKVLGYNLEVFDVANACLQDDITAMTKKTPAERKKMIDKTLGLDSIDALIKETSEKMSNEKTRISTLEGTLASLNNIEHPEKPSGYESQEVLTNYLTTLISRKSNAESDLKRLTAAVCETPTRIEMNIQEPLESLEFYAEKMQWKAGIDAQIKQLYKKRESLIPFMDYHSLSSDAYWNLKGYVAENIPAQHEAYNKFKQEQEQLTLFVNQCPFSPETIDELLEAHTYIPIIKSIEVLEDSTKVKCPECKHEFSLQQDKLNELKAKLPDNIDYLMQLFTASGNPTIMQLNAYKEERRKLDSLIKVAPPDVAYNGTIAEVMSKLNEAYRVEEAKEEFKEVEESLEELYRALAETGDEDYALSFKIKQDCMRYEAQYQKDMEKYNTYLKLKSEIDATPQLVSALESQIQSQRALMTECASYDNKFDMFQKTAQIRAGVEVELTKSKSELERLTNISKALKEIKPKVKSYLVPSLSAVASNFIAQMTNNKRNKVDITEDFDITVDSQPVETLSGSGKSVANIAIRLALGTVLTNKVFSVFMADEIDAAMDQERAESTALCLRNLTNVYSQVILISHKKPEADNYIEL